LNKLLGITFIKPVRQNTIPVVDVDLAGNFRQKFERKAWQLRLQRDDVKRWEVRQALTRSEIESGYTRISRNENNNYFTIALLFTVKTFLQEKLYHLAHGRATIFIQVPNCPFICCLAGQILVKKRQIQSLKIGYGGLYVAPTSDLANIKARICMELIL